MTDPLHSNQPTATPPAWTDPPTDGERAAHRRERFKRLLELAQIYSGLDQRALGKRLSRDPSRLVPNSGNPGLDQITAIAEVLDWPASEVIRTLKETPFESESPLDQMRVLDTLEPDPRYVGLEFSELDRQSIRAHRSGDFETMVSIGQWMLQVAKAPREKVFAYNRWSGGLNGQGQYVQAMDVIKTALRETDLPPSERCVMQINLANGHFTLCNLIEARTIATELINELQEVPAEEHAFTTRARLAFLYYVRGHTLRRMMDGSHDSVRRYAEAAMSDLLVAEKRHTNLAEETKDPYLRALATVSAGGQLELKALLESSDAGTECIEAMPGYHTLTEALLSKGDIGLECQGWLSIFATNIARRHLEGTERANALTKHAQRILKVANRLDNWTFRAAAYEAMHLADPNRAPWLENPAELQLMIETMGRLPVFRETGWRILSDTGALERAARVDPRTWRKGLRCA